ncbi:MAG: molybdenum cofactor guanylyltransferase [Planctomycetota bacterium]
MSIRREGAAPSAPVLPLPVYILAGGKSSRFGGDKARAQVRGRALILHLTEALQPVASRFAVVADRVEKYTDLGLRTLADRRADAGPLAGIETALEDSDPATAAGPGEDSGWRLIVSCDWVGLRAAWVEALARAAAADGGPIPPAVAFHGERWEPLLALVHVALRPAIAAMFTAGDTAVWRLLDRAGARKLPLPTDWSAAAQVNTPQQLADWLARQDRGKI